MFSCFQVKLIVSPYWLYSNLEFIILILELIPTLKFIQSTFNVSKQNHFTLTHFFIAEPNILHSSMNSNKAYKSFFTTTRMKTLISTPWNTSKVFQIIMTFLIPQQFSLSLLFPLWSQNFTLAFAVSPWTTSLFQKDDSYSNSRYYEWQPTTHFWSLENDYDIKTHIIIK